MTNASSAFVSVTAVDVITKMENMPQMTAMEPDLCRAAELVMAQLGPRQREVVYAKALATQLQAMGMLVQVEAPVPIIYTPTAANMTCAPTIVGVERADLLIMTPWLAIVECKIAETITVDQANQAKRYAFNCNSQDCYAISFGRSGTVTVLQVKLD